MSHLRIASDDHGNINSVQLNDVEISPQLMAFHIHARAHEHPVILLELAPGVVLDGDYEVQVLPPPMAPADVFLTVLNAIDPQEIKTDALRELGWGGNEGFIECVFEALKRKVQPDGDQS